MNAAVYYGPRDVRVETVPMPTAGPGEVVLRVLRCSVCGTDKRIFAHGHKNVVPPTVTGHEIVGTVYEVGAGVDAAIAIGRKVMVATVVGCGKCIHCQRKQYNLCDSFTALGYDCAGGFAEYVKIPAAAVAQGKIILVPPAMALERAALVEPLSCCLSGQEYLNAQPGDRALVFGAGPIGLMHAAILKARGCDPVIVTDVSDERFAGIPKDDPVLPIDTNSIHYNEIAVFACFASNLQHFHQALEMISRDGMWDRFVTHRL